MVPTVYDSQIYIGREIHIDIELTPGVISLIRFFSENRKMFDFMKTRVKENPIEYFRGKYLPLNFVWRSHPDPEGICIVDPFLLVDTLYTTQGKTKAREFMANYLWAVMRGKDEELLDAAFGKGEDDSEDKPKSS